MAIYECKYTVLLPGRPAEAIIPCLIAVLKVTGELSKCQHSCEGVTVV